MNESDHIYFKNRREFKDWLTENHDKSPGIWMLYYKKHVKTDCIHYKDALEEALCFGWIDSIIKKVDEEKYVRRFTPRSDTKNWSDVNKRIVSGLLKEGKMTEAGLSKIDGSVMAEIENLNTETVTKEKKAFEIPEFIISELAKNEPALTNFNNLAQSYKKQYVLWITSAKREETVKKRIEEAIGLLKENKKLTSK